MAKVIVVYESKYGNTKLVAEEITAGIKEASGKVEVILSEVKQVVLVAGDLHDERRDDPRKQHQNEDAHGFLGVADGIRPSHVSP